MAAGRPKKLEGKLVPFNSKITEDHKEKIDAIIKVSGFKSVRELLESWTESHLETNPKDRERIEAYLNLKKEV